MVKTGETRMIDDLGRVVIPKIIRQMLEIEPGDRLEILLDGNDVIFRKLANKKSSKKSPD